MKHNFLEVDEDQVLHLMDKTCFRMLVQIYYLAIENIFIGWLFGEADRSSGLITNKGTMSIDAIVSTLDRALDDKSIFSSHFADRIRSVIEQSTSTGCHRIAMMAEKPPRGKEGGTTLWTMHEEMSKNENKKIIERLTGNADEKLDSLERMIKKLYNTSLKDFREGRNIQLHLPKSIFQSDSHVWLKLDKAGKQSHEAIIGVGNILNFVSVAIFGKSPLPTWLEYTKHNWHAPADHLIWCNDISKYPIPEDMLIVLERNDIHLEQIPGINWV